MKQAAVTLTRGLEKVEQVMGKTFSEEQRKIITHYGKPLNVIACAGAGKTTVSIAHMLMLELVQGIKPYNILSVTFSKKASVEISDRYLASRDKIGNVRQKPTFKTFHALFLMLLKELPEYKSYSVANANEFKYELFKHVKTDGLRDKGDVFDSYMNIRSALINKGLSPDGIKGVEELTSFKDSGVDYLNYVLVIKEYNRLKVDKEAFDFDDMQVFLLEELKNGSPELVSRFHSAYSHVILDEYQDISPIQNDIINLLLSPKQVKGLMAIGDDDQAIYGFRGSDPKYIINFIYNYPNAKRYFLSTNYRCMTDILDEVKPSISHNFNRVDKPLTAFNAGGKVSYLDTSTIRGSDKFRDLLMDDLTSGKEISNIAVLVRFNSQRILLADTLAENGIPVDIGDVKFLLSNSSIYKALMDVVQMVKEENGYLFNRHYFKFGKHINKDSVRKYAEHKETNWYMDVMNGAFDFPTDVLDLFRGIKHAETAYTMLLNAWKLLRPNFKQMADKGYINLDNTVEVVFHMLNLCKDTDGNHTIDFETLQRAEEHKRVHLIKFINDPETFKINTMHSVKGLEYRKVYLYGLSERMVNNEKWSEALQAEDRLKESAETMSTLDEKDVEDVLASIFDYSVSVEEERRVFYVACTRAEEELILCYEGKRPLALLEEMKGFNESKQVKEPISIEE